MRTRTVARSRRVLTAVWAVREPVAQMCGYVGESSRASPAVRAEVARGRGRRAGAVPPRPRSHHALTCSASPATCSSTLLDHPRPAARPATRRSPLDPRPHRPTRPSAPLAPQQPVEPACTPHSDEQPLRGGARKCVPPPPLRLLTSRSPPPHDALTLRARPSRAVIIGRILGTVGKLNESFELLNNEVAVRPPLLLPSPLPSPLSLPAQLTQPDPHPPAEDQRPDAADDRGRRAVERLHAQRPVEPHEPEDAATARLSSCSAGSRSWFGPGEGSRGAVHVCV